MQLIRRLLSNFYLNMFRTSLCPSSGEQKCAQPHMVFYTGCDGCGCVHTARVPAPHNHSHHNQCRTPYAAVHTLFLLMMGIMMPETCWDRSLIINIRLVASCWFLSLRPTFMMHGHKSPKKKRYTGPPGWGLGRWASTPSHGGKKCWKTHLHD